MIRGIENAAAVATLAAMTLLPLAAIVARAFFAGGVTGSIPIVQHLTLWITLLGGALAAREDRLLALSTASFLPERRRAPVRTFTTALAVAVTGTLVVASVALVRVDFEYAAEIAWGIPVWAASVILPVGFAAIAARLVRSAGAGRAQAIVALGLLVPAALAIAPETALPALAAPLAVLLVAGTLLGMPVFAAIGGAALLLFWLEGTPLAEVPGEAYRLSTSPMLPAIPLFTLGGFVLAAGGSSRRLARLCTALVGWIPGGAAIVTTLVLAFFTPLTGASGITILSMGGLFHPMLLRERYPERTSLGLVTVAGSIGLLFPPSLPVILYAYYADIDVERLFLGGLAPGVLLVSLVAGTGAWRGWRSGAARSPFDGAEARAALAEARWDLFLPVVILAGIFGGFMTLVEASAVTVLYAVVIECFVFRTLRVAGDLPRVAIESATLVGGFMIILGVALAFSSYLIVAQVPMHVLDWLRAHVESPALFLLALNGLLLVVGALMDVYSAILVVAPLVIPLAAPYGIDPVHLGIVFLANMQLGYLMPPMGENLFLASYRFNRPLAVIYRATLPYILVLAAAALLITYFPPLTLWCVPPAVGE